MDGKQQKEIRDHLGNVYNSIADMCRAYEKTQNQINARLRNGWTLEEALTIPIMQSRDGKILHRGKFKDHLGNEYRSMTEMCEAYGKERLVVSNRLKRGWSLEKALTIDTASHYRTLNPFNNKWYNTCKDICDIYGIDYILVNKRLEKHKWDFAVALVVPTGENNRLQLKFIGLDGKAYYFAPWSKKENHIVSAREVIEYYRPDLLASYDKCNPNQKYRHSKYEV